MSSAKSVFFETFGCQMNKYDSDALAERFFNQGFHLSESAAKADLIVVNTCSVRLHAEERALARIRELSGQKAKGSALLVIGCMAKRMGDELRRRIAGIDMIAGPGQYADLLARVLAHERLDRFQKAVGPRSESTRAPVSAFAAVMHGCNNRCSYCIVPYVRGPERSRPVGEILDEIRRKLDAGSREIVLLGQNVNSYHEGAVLFPDLLRKVNDMKYDFRLRFLTSHPKDLSDDLIAAMAGCAKVCGHLHLPLQSGSDAVLERMNRKYGSAQYLARVAKIRKAIPGVSLTTDVLVGFPGETGEDFEATLAILLSVRFDEAFTYRYSVRPGTPAAQWEDSVPEDEKKRRLVRLISIQRDITKSQLEKYIGRTEEILFEKTSSRGKSEWWGRTRTARPVVASGANLCEGALAKVKILKSTGATLLGETVDGRRMA